ncbi:hypothetical protein TNCV_1746771 [Trichonephila clavipes]|nr:hypothetical protein TNCV_1746771 [Trichonephila clavipes]
MLKHKRQNNSFERHHTLANATISENTARNHRLLPAKFVSELRIRKNPMGLDLGVKSKSAISRLKKIAGGNTLRNHVEGQGRNPISLEDRYVALVAKRKRNSTLGRIAASLATATGTHLSARTISP